MNNYSLIFYKNYIAKVDSQLKILMEDIIYIIFQYLQMKVVMMLMTPLSFFIIQGEEVNKLGAIVSHGHHILVTIFSGR